MLLDMDWNIEFRNEGKEGKKLLIVASVEITKDVNNLADIATIFLPNHIMNETISFNKTIYRGSEVLIQLGYNGRLNDEFFGFVQDVVHTNSALEIRCEDALFLFRKPLPDKELKPTSLPEIARYITQEIDPSYKVECDYPIGYEKFTIHQATGYDVLKKLQEETKANIYFDTKNKTLHIHSPFIQKGKNVYYSMQKNIEASSLEFKNMQDYKLEVTIESTDTKGNVKSVSSGTTGGDKITFKVGAQNEESIKLVADAELYKRSAPRYEGSFDTWLIPEVEPTDSARIKDEDFPEKTAFYYVESVVTSFSSTGGKRTVKPGIKLS